MSAGFIHLHVLHGRHWGTRAGAQRQGAALGGAGGRQAAQQARAAGLLHQNLEGLGAHVSQDALHDRAAELEALRKGGTVQHAPSVPAGPGEEREESCGPAEARGPPEGTD